MIIKLTPIAYVSNSRKEVTDDFWGGIVSEIKLTDDFTADALEGLGDYSHAEIIFHFNKADKNESVTGKSHPRGNTAWPETGIFAMRKKDRPNHLGLTIVKIEKVEEKSLFVTGFDAIDGTPVLDIKPVLKDFLPNEEIKEPGWVSELMQDYWKEN